MNLNEYGHSRPRATPNGDQMHPASRPVYDSRNGQPSSQIPMPNGNASVGSQISRAEKFEDEKKRLIESCFNKKESDGSLSESYITHIRIEEDAAYPSSPPPPHSAPENKKPRVIVVAVRKSGRVRMHKARENANGTFSIGKTWVLDDLTLIESFTNAVPTTAEEQQNKQRAGTIGFVVTVQKPYYWQAATAKEKDFFIFSLIKIFKKYTGGRLPELRGFGQGELDQLGSVGSSSDSPAAAHMLSPGARLANQETKGVREVSNPPESSREPRMRPSLDRPNHERVLHSSSSGQEPTRTLHSATTQERPLRTATSNERMYMPGSFPSTESVNTQNIQLRKKRSESPGSQSTISQQSNFRRREGQQHPEGLRTGVESRSSERGVGYQPSNEFLRPNGVPLPPILRAGSADTTASSAFSERPNTSARNEDFSKPQTLEEDLASRPPQLTNRSYQKAAPAPDVSNLNGDIKQPVERRNNEGKPWDQPPASNALESSRDRADGSVPPPTTAPVETVQNGHSIGGDKFAKARTGGWDDVAVEKPDPQGVTVTPTPTPPPETPTEQEGFRPGLGPMIKKKSTKEIASTFRRAAATANAFKPRPGGAGEKVNNEASSGGDGITGVFQAPSLLRGVSQDDSRPTTPREIAMPRPSTPQKSPEVPSIQIPASPIKLPTNPPLIAPEPPSTQGHNEGSWLAPPKENVSIETSQEDRRKRRRSDHSARYAKILGIHPSLLEGRTFEIEDALNSVGWNEGRSDQTTFEKLQSDIRKELAYVEAGSWLEAVENNDDRTKAVGEMMDRVMAECDELDCLLTLYNVELGTLTEDVAYIEAQSQGLQVQTANQKLLQTELKNLIDTISISSSDLKVLKDASLTKPRGIQEVEHTLAQLYAAMLTIDPKLAHNGTQSLVTDHNSLHRNSTGYRGSELSSMLAVREKRDGFRRDSINFIQRLKQYMSVKFRESEAETMDALERKKNIKVSENGTALDPRLREDPRSALWLYSPLLLFVREIEPSEWDDIVRMYEGCAKKPYQDEFRDNVFAWKRITRKPAGDEQDILFTTTQEKESDNLVGRKLTVKRSKTVRSDGTSRISTGDKPNDGKLTAYEAFAGALTETAKIIFVEQNFLVEMFHASSLESQDFIDAIGTGPEQRTGGDLLVKKPFDPDRDMARKVLGVMEEIFSFWPTEVQNLVDWAVKQDTLNVVGLLFALESQLSEVEETNQEFLSQAVSKVHDRLVTQFARFVEEQVRGIEDTKVKIKKRKGVIAFVKTFPNFTAAVENMLPPTRSLDHLPIRNIVNDAYQSINKAMFESLKYIAKESPSATGGATIASGDPEDKEALNLHILLVENMNHYIEEVPVRGNSVLEDWSFRARAEMSEHMNLYLSTVVRRPLGKLLDFVESTETLLKNLPASQSPPTVATRASHSRSVFKKLLGSYDGKEIRRGAETLKKRVEKHFGDAEESPGMSRELVLKVLKECEARYSDVTARVERLIRDIYEGGLEIEWKREDFATVFRR